MAGISAIVSAVTGSVTCAGTRPTVAVKSSQKTFFVWAFFPNAVEHGVRVRPRGGADQLRQEDEERQEEHGCEDEGDWERGGRAGTGGNRFRNTIFL